VEAQGEAAFEKDHRNGKRDKGKEQIAEKGVGVEPAGERTTNDPGKEEKENGGQLYPPGKPLTEDTGKNNRGQDENLIDQHRPFLLLIFVDRGRTLTNQTGSSPLPT